MYTIISFNGGGIRGLLSSQVVMRLMKHRPNVLEQTSMFAGTSIGAQIAAAAGSGAIRGQGWQDEQIGIMRLGFSGPAGDPMQPAYKEHPFHQRMNQLYGGMMLSRFPRPIVITAFQVTPGVPWKPVLFNNVLPDAEDVLVVDAVEGSGTMPGMFGSYRAGNTQVYVDGGFFDHDPSVAAIGVAVRSGVPLQDIALIDIGTGLMPQYIPYNTDTSEWGALQWQTHRSPEAYPVLLVNGTPGPVLNLGLNGTSGGTGPMLGRLLLRDRYVSVNPLLPGFIAENDVDGIPALLDAANQANLDEATALIDACWSA